MGYLVVPSVITGDSWSAAQHNTYIRDNLSALWPYSAAGDLAIASSSTTLSRLAVGSEGQVLAIQSGTPGWKTLSTLQDVYPVGSVYISTSSTNPATTFGFGTWTAVAGRVLVGAGTSDATYTGGATGGESTHTLTTAEMPSHTHVQDQHRHSYTTPTGDNLIGSGPHGTWDLATTTAYTGYTTPTNQNTGGGGTHNNMPPYLVVYIWTRTA